MTPDPTGFIGSGPTTHRQPQRLDVQRMTSKLFLTDGPDSRVKLSAFWVLIVLATIIASAGIIADSTATVIGAMIVAPLMTPILGTALSVVLARKRLILTNLALVVAGGAAVVLIAFLLGLTIHSQLLAEMNSQVATRVSPRLIDLVAAIATGVVGAFAIVRSDVSDTLPGVAIAISLVPPLCVVGLTLESGAPSQAAGALLLFGTNVGAIIATGTLVFLLYRVRAEATELGADVRRLSRGTIAVILGSVAALTVPLGLGSAVVVEQEVLLARAAPVAAEWAASQGWQVSDLSVREGVLRIVALGPPLAIAETGLREKLDSAGLEHVDARVTLVLGGSKALPGR